MMDWTYTGRMLRYSYHEIQNNVEGHAVSRGEVLLHHLWYYAS